MPSLDVYFLDVGQGDGTFIVCPDGTTILVDLGSKKNGHIAGNDAIVTIKGLLKSKTIDHLFLTHGDGDHYNLIPEMVDTHGISFGKVYYGGQKSDYSSEMQSKVIDAFSSSSFFGKAHSTQTSPLLTIGTSTKTVKVFLLSANYPSPTDSDKNAKSIVLMLVYANRKIILMGDAEVETEDFIMESFPNNFLQADVLKLAHHGSNGSNQQSWLDVVQPRIVAASGDQKWGHPYSETLDRVSTGNRLANIYQHGIVAGEYSSRAKDYDWKTSSTKKAILTNLYKITGTMGVSWQAYGIAYVVQVNDDGKLGVGDTLDNASGWF